MFKSIFFTLGLFAAVAFGQLTINTPSNVVECQPILLTWVSGTPPYYVSVLPGGQPSATALVTFPQTNGTSLTWNVNIQAGTSIGLTIRDNTGSTAQSAPFTINPGSSSCLSSSLSASAGTSTGAAATTPAGTTTTSSAAVPSATITTPASSPSSSGTGTTSAAGAAKTGGASINAANLGVAGVIGAAVMAILA